MVSAKVSPAERQDSSKSHFNPNGFRYDILESSGPPDHDDLLLKLRRPKEKSIFQVKGLRRLINSLVVNILKCL